MGSTPVVTRTHVFSFTSSWFDSKQVKFLGRVLSEHGFSIGDDRVKAISE